jgi:hypothetical protein
VEDDEIYGMNHNRFSRSLKQRYKTT